MAVRRRKKSENNMPGLLALVITAVLMLVLVLLLLLGGEAEPPVTEPLTWPPTEAPTPTIPANPYRPVDFTYGEDGYLTCMAGESVLGIDVSSYQGDIDWARVREAGVEFVIIRLGFRGYTKGGLEADELAAEYYQGARDAGLKVGAYVFSQAISVEEALEEARFVLDTVRDWTLEMPLVYDWEYVSEEARTGDMDRRLLTDCTLAFCEAVAQAGYEPMIYFNPYQAQDLLHLEELTAYRWWLAKYDGGMDYPHRVDMWQYTDQGTVPGIEGAVDLNLWFPPMTDQ